MRHTERNTDGRMEGGPERAGSAGDETDLAGNGTTEHIPGAACELAGADTGLLQPFPLGEAALPHETLSRAKEAEREEEEEWRAEAAAARRKTPSGGWKGGEMPDVSALMEGPWKGARWWRTEGAGGPPAGSEEGEAETWRRMVCWGMPCRTKCMRC